jgi:hypothetical protein
LILTEIREGTQLTWSLKSGRLESRAIDTTSRRLSESVPSFEIADFLTLLVPFTLSCLFLFSPFGFQRWCIKHTRSFIVSS